MERDRWGEPVEAERQAAERKARSLEQRLAVGAFALVLYYAVALVIEAKMNMLPSDGPFGLRAWFALPTFILVVSWFAYSAIRQRRDGADPR